MFGNLASTKLLDDFVGQSEYFTSAPILDKLKDVGRREFCFGLT